MSLALRVSELEGIRLKNEIVPWGHNFEPIETSLTWHTSHTRVHLPWKFQLSDSFRLGCTPAKVYLLRVHAAARGTCHVARGATWQTPSSFRRFGASFGVCRVQIGPSVRRYSQKSLGHTDRLTDKQARPSCKNPPYPQEISIHQNGLTSILLHYDFELEAICFEPLVSRSLVWFFNTFRVIMFIEAGDVTHRRRGQNRNEEFRDFFLSFYTKFFFDPNLFILA